MFSRPIGFKNLPPLMRRSSHNSSTIFSMEMVRRRSASRTNIDASFLRNQPVVCSPVPESIPTNQPDIAMDKLNCCTGSCSVAPHDGDGPRELAVVIPITVRSARTVVLLNHVAKASWRGPVACFSGQGRLASFWSRWALSLKAKLFTQGAEALPTRPFARTGSVYDVRELYGFYL